MLEARKEVRNFNFQWIVVELLSELINSGIKGEKKQGANEQCT